MPSLSIVIPAYNEETTIGDVARKTLEVLQRNLQDFEIIILNDGSADRTGLIAESMAREHPGAFRIMHHEKNRGIAATFNELFAAAHKEYICEIPGDGQVDPLVIERMIPLLASFDVVVCNRMAKNYGSFRQIVSACYRKLPDLLFGVELFDPGCVKCRRKEIITGIPVISKGVFVEAERLIRASMMGYKIGKIDIQALPRTGGRSSGSRPAVLLQAVVDMLRVWIDLKMHKPHLIREQNGKSGL